MRTLCIIIYARKVLNYLTRRLFMKTVYTCQLCGYEYEVKVGDPENGIDPETEFDELPADWVCPLCGASKEDFEAQQVEA